MEKKIELTDEAVIPVMEKMKVSREEAEKRLQLLMKSGIIDHFDPDNIESQMMVDNFLSQDSETLAGTVAYEKAFTQCLNNKDLVRQYDRLTFSSLGKAIVNTNKGNPPANFKEQLEKFEKFCEETIFSRLPQY